MTPSRPPDTPTDVGPSGDEALDIREYLRILRRKWWMVLGMGALTTAAVWWFQRDEVPVPVYTAETLVQRLPDAERVGFGVVRAGDETLASELEILRTRAVLGSVVDSLGLRLVLPELPHMRSRIFDSVEVLPEATPRWYTLRPADEGVELLTDGTRVASAGLGEPLVALSLAFRVSSLDSIPPGGTPVAVQGTRQAISALDESLVIQQRPGTNLISIRYTSRDPEQSVSVVNEMARAYRAHSARRAREAAQRRIALTESQLAMVADSLALAESALVEFERGTTRARGGEALSGQLTTAESRANELERRRDVLTDLLINLDSINPGRRDDLTRLMVELGGMVPTLNTQFQRLQEYENQLQGFRGRGLTDNASEVRTVQQLIEETRRGMRIQAEAALNVTGDDLEEVNATIRRLEGQAGAAPGQNITRQQLERRLESLQSSHGELSTLLYEARIAAESEMGNIQVVDAADAAALSYQGGNRQNLAVALALGLLLGFGLAVAADRLDTRIHRPEEVRRYSGSEIVGTIPTLSVVGNSGRRPLLSTGDTASEAFRMLRTNLRFVRTEELHVVAVTSAGPQEGKSVIASNLAMAFAQEGKKVLLVDADLRRPVVHTVFGFERKPGLSDILVGEDTSGIVHKDAAQGVDVIVAGTAVPNPAELVGSQAFKDFLRRAREHYDIVLVDTPPVLAVTDASLIAGGVDGVLLVARQEKTPRQALHNAADQLRRARAPILGVVINGVDTGGGRYGGGYYGYYGYGYGAKEYAAGRNGAPAGKRSLLSRLPFFG